MSGSIYTIIARKDSVWQGDSITLLLLLFNLPLLLFKANCFINPKKLPLYKSGRNC